MDLAISKLRWVQSGLPSAIHRNHHGSCSASVSDSLGLQWPVPLHHPRAIAASPRQPSGWMLRWGRRRTEACQGLSVLSASPCAKGNQPGLASRGEKALQLASKLRGKPHCASIHQARQRAHVSSMCISCCLVSLELSGTSCERKPGVPSRHHSTTPSQSAVV